MSPDSILPTPEDDIARILANFEKRISHLERLEGPGGGAWTLIETVELAAPALSIDFQNIPQTFQHLKAIGSTRDDRGFGTSDIGARINNLSTNIYDWLVDLIRHNNVEATQEGLTDTQWKIGSHPAANAPANVFGPWEFLLPDYIDTTKKHSFIAMTHNLQVFDSTGNTFIRWGGGTVDEAAAISRLTFRSFQAANLVAGSIISLYGISG